MQKPLEMPKTYERKMRHPQSRAKKKRATSGGGGILRTVFSKKAEHDITRPAKRCRAAREFFLEATRKISPDNSKHLFCRDGLAVFSAPVPGKQGWRITYVNYNGSAVIWRCFTNHGKYESWIKAAKDKDRLHGRIVLDLTNGKPRIVVEQS